MSVASCFASLHFYSPFPKTKSLFLRTNPSYTPVLSPPKHLKIRSAKRPARTGKLRYPSEKKKLTQVYREKIDIKNKFKGFWRMSQLGVEVQKDPGKDFLGVSDALLEQIAKVLEFPVASMLPAEAFSVVRKSFDARKLLKEPKFVYTVDMDVEKLLILEPRMWDFISQLEPQVGFLEHVSDEKVSGDLISILYDCKMEKEQKIAGHTTESTGTCKFPAIKKPKVAVVGCGPSGLFVSLVLAELGADVSLIERGHPVEQRGRDIGALVVRRIMQLDSNFCFGEGGAGTWSDGKLVTRIGKNSASVQAVMKMLVHFGAPESILVDGKPHLGTDRLIPLLRSFRRHLQGLGVSIKFGTRVDDLLVEGTSVVGVKVSDSTKGLLIERQELKFDAVVLAVGHSARDVYQMLLSHNVYLVPKDFAVGLRIEHPQELINHIQDVAIGSLRPWLQREEEKEERVGGICVKKFRISPVIIRKYSGMATEVHKGRGKLPVADYRVANYVNEQHSLVAANYGCYSFCMCPGGQIVLTSTDPSEICINGMSFSQRASKWANAAIVVTVSLTDFNAMNFHGPLAGVLFQRELEKRAAMMGGGNLVVPVQKVADFLENKLSGTPVPSSSYRLGVRPASLHELFPIHITEALQDSISMFDKELPGFVSEDALLHGVETRTSSPIQIPRDVETYESTSLKGLYPIGEGAGYAGGIVSAAVDGIYAGFAVAKNLGLCTDGIESALGKAPSPNAGFVKY